MSEKFDLVDRPLNYIRGGANGVGLLTQAVLDTLETGGAVRVQLNGRQNVSVRSSIDQTVKKRGLRLRMRTEADKSSVLLWVEKREAK